MNVQNGVRTMVQTPLKGGANKVNAFSIENMGENNVNCQNVRSDNLPLSDNKGYLSARKSNARRSVRGGRVGGMSRSPFNRKNSSGTSANGKSTSPTSTSSASTAASVESVNVRSTSPKVSQRSPTGGFQRKQPDQGGLNNLLNKFRRRRDNASSVSSSSEEEDNVMGAQIEQDDKQQRAHAVVPETENGHIRQTFKSAVVGGVSLSTPVMYLFQVLLLALAILFVSPTYEVPGSSTKPFFHTVNHGDSFAFEIDVKGWPEPTVQWRLNGVDIPGATEPRLQIPKAGISHSGTYTCLMENMAGRSVWEEGYVNVVDASKKEAEVQASVTENISTEENISKSAKVSGDSETVRHARMCLLRRAPEPVLRSASVDGGAAVIAAGETAGYLDCFDGLKRMLSTADSSDPKRAERQIRALDLLRSMHGSSRQRKTLVNAVSALNDLALAKLQARPAQEIEDLAAKLAFEAGLWCASTPHCVGDARSRIVRIIMNALDVDKLL